MFDQVGIRHEYSLLFEALGDAGIAYCLLRDDLRAGDAPKDLDVLVDSDRFQETLEILGGMGYRVAVTHRFIPFKTALTKFTGGQFIAIDLHAELVQSAIKYMDARQVLARRRPIEDYFLPTDSDLLAILVFHNIIGKRRIQEKHYPQICELANSADREDLQLGLREYGTFPILCEVLDDVETYYREPRRAQQAREEMIRRLRHANPGLRRRMFALRLRRWWRRHDPRPRAPLWAFLGVDGSGKSSLTAALVDLLNQQNGYSAVQQYMGPWGQHRVKLLPNSPYVPGWSLTVGEWIAELLRKQPRQVGLVDTARIILKTMIGRPFTEHERVLHQRIREHSRLFLTLRMVRSLLRAAAFFTLLAVEMYYRYWCAYRYRRRRTIVIADRYIYDIMTGTMRRSVSQYRRTRQLVCRLFFRPTRTFLLHSDFATILARKDDLSPDELKEFQAVYDELADKYSFERVETDAPPEMLARRLVERLFDELSERLRT
ncbi:MAG: hypothetical protein OER90_03525 [Gemmatimonadota bacterium]|nr:hypothetical protein [Gemmatimonadota bacterium]